MENKDKNRFTRFEPGVYGAKSTSSLKSIANKPMEAYNRIPGDSEADLKRKKAEAEMAASSFRAKPFVSPISGRRKTDNVEVMVAHGRYDQSAKRIVPKKEPILLTEEAMANATFTLKSDISKILKQAADDERNGNPIQGRLVFSTMEGEFAIDADLVRVKLENSDVYAQYDRTLDDVLNEQFGKSMPSQQQQKTEHESLISVSKISQNHLIENEQQNLQICPSDDEVIEFDDEDDFELDEIVEPVETVVYEKKEVPDDFYYETPTLDLLNEGARKLREDEEWVESKMEILESTFENFGVGVVVTGNYIQGATVTQFEIAPEPGTKLNKILSLSDDLKLAMSVDDLRIEQISGKSTIGIEIANDVRRVVTLREILSSHEFILHKSPLYVGLGEDITGAAIYTDIMDTPHTLIAGQTGSGKSVCINALILSILYKATPDVVRLMLIDPKQVEMAPYNDIPHLVTPVISDEKKAATALSWAVDEMENRYSLFAKNGVRDIKTFNNRRHEFVPAYELMPYIVIIIDELADLMMVASQDVEDSIMRLTQKARAAGIHLIVATQRPTVNVITGTIKSNIPTRIAFAVAQANDSRVIIDANGAEDLLGRGDMLVCVSGNKTKRVQGAYVSDEEINRVVNAVKSQSKPQYLIAEDALDKRIDFLALNEDPLEQESMHIFITEKKASVSLLQRKLSIGYNRAARIVDKLEEKGFITGPIGTTSKRDVLITEKKLKELYYDS